MKAITINYFFKYITIKIILIKVIYFKNTYFVGIDCMPFFLYDGYS